MYQLAPTFKGVQTCVVRLSDNAAIPFDPQNVDYVAYLEWLAEGNVPTPADQPTE